MVEKPLWMKDWTLKGMIKLMNRVLNEHTNKILNEVVKYVNVPIRNASVEKEEGIKSFQKALLRKIKKIKEDMLEEV